MDWTCHICGMQRLDCFISVRTIDTSEEFGLSKGTMTQNVRYCNDNAECIEGSKTKRLYSKKL